MQEDPKTKPPVVEAPSPLEPYRLIVLEGPDGMGKSTLAKQLDVGFGDTWLLWHTGGPKTRAELDDILGQIAHTTKDPDGLCTILDRAPHLSEIVYRPLNEGAEPMAPEERASLLRAFYALNPLVVYCRTREVRPPRPETRPHKSPEYWSKIIADHPRIVQAYDSLMDELSCPIYHYDYTEERALTSLLEWFDEVTTLRLFQIQKGC